MYVLVFGNSLLVLHLLIGHLCKKEFQPYKIKPFIISIVAILGLIAFIVFDKECAKTYELYIHYALAIYLLTSSLITFASIVRQMEKHLGIKAFSITPKIKKN